MVSREKRSGRASSAAVLPASQLKSRSSAAIRSAHCSSRAVEKSRPVVALTIRAQGSAEKAKPVKRQMPRLSWMMPWFCMLRMAMGDWSRLKRGISRLPPKKASETA